MIHVIGIRSRPRYPATMKKILVPLDGSALAEKALTTAMTLSRRWQAQLLAVRVVNPFVAQPAGTPDLALQVNQLEKEAATSYLGTVSASIEKAGLQGTVLMALGEPISQIVKLAGARHVALVCLKSRGRSGLQRFFMGSTAEGVLRRSPAPLLLCRGDRGPGPLGFQSVVVPCDGSPLSLEVLPRLEPYLAPGAQITLLRASDDTIRRSSLHFEADTYRDYLTGLEAELARLDPEGRFRHVVRDADPSESILNVAAEQEADLVAMATHGRSGFQRLFLGSVTERVARHAHCSVLALPPTALSEVTRAAQQRFESGLRAEAGSAS